jgi:predicted ATP-grasp superfamily ATP-dependent carboligase
MSNPPAIVLGGTVTALSIARSLADAGVPAYVLDHRGSPARRSRLCDFVEVDRDDMQARMLQWLRSGPRGAVVLAGGDEGLELIARNRSELVELGYIPMEADDEVLLAMLDKERTDELARACGIPVPRVLPLRERSDLALVAREFGFPCVLKPVHSHVFVRRTGSGGKVVRAADKAALENEFERLSALGVEMMAIEVIAGPDDEYVSYYGYLDESGAPLLELTKRKLRLYPNGWGSGTYHGMTRDPEVAELGLRFLQGVRLRGLGNVEFKRDRNDGQLKLIECNARFTMSNELIRAAGIDLALFSYNRLLGRPVPRVDRYDAGIRLWDPIRDTRAFLEYRRNGELSLAAWLASLVHRQRLRTWRLDDPMPALGGIARQLTGVVSKRVARPGGRTAKLASRTEVLRAAGPGYAWRRVRADRTFAPFKREARNEVYERIWREAAEASGASITKLAADTLEISRDAARARVRHQDAGLDDPATLKLALDKVQVHRLLADAGLAIPEHVEFDASDPAAALEFLRRSGSPCVVKPAAGSGGGHGTTAGIRTEAELTRARRNAARGGARMLIERQARGAVFRLLFLDGELLDVVRSVPGHLTGDGRSSVIDLIFAENERRVAARGAAGVELLGAGLDMVLALERAGLRLSSVVPAGQRIALGDVTNNNSVHDNQTFRGALADELVAEAAAAQRVVGLRLAGVDVITEDPALPLHSSGGVINEVNGTPGLHHHYLVAEPEHATRVAIPVIERVLAGSAENGASPQGAVPPSPLSRLDPA